MADQVRTGFEPANDDASSAATKADMQHDATARGVRKRGSRAVRQPLSSKVKEREGEARLLLEALQRLSVDNLLSTHRHAMLELVRALSWGRGVQC
jgi:hypothetical protein